MLASFRLRGLWLCVRASISLVDEETVVMGLAFLNCSIWPSSVLKVSSVRILLAIVASIALFGLRMRRSYTPPKSGACAGLKF